MSVLPQNPIVQRSFIVIFPPFFLRQVGLFRKIQKGLDRLRLFDCDEVLAEQVLHEGYLGVVSLDEDGGGGKIN